MSSQLGKIYAGLLYEVRYRATIVTLEGFGTSVIIFSNEHLKVTLLDPRAPLRRKSFLPAIVAANTKIKATYSIVNGFSYKS